MIQYFCCDEQRRIAIKGHPLLNGIDFLEVVDNKGDAYELRQTMLVVHFINPLLPGALERKNVVIQGGERITGIQVMAVSFAPASPPSPPSSPPDAAMGNLLYVKVDKAGDFSAYTLRLVQDAAHPDPPAGFDPVLSSVLFSFKVLCESDFDCGPSQPCTNEQQKAPEISYLAKDYASFRQLMLDRMALLVPQWQERNPADIGIVLIELLAYAGDYLSYRQDAVATEAYLGTARKRVSVKRHARLVDYVMHDGSNARTWVHVEVKPGVQNLPLKATVNGEKTKVLTTGTHLPTVLRADSRQFETARGQGLQTFELMHDINLHERHNEMHFYTWLQDECCLPRGATSATLDGHFPALAAGQVLIFAEVAGPLTGQPGDADPLHRHALLLTKVELAVDPVGYPAQSPPDFTPRPVTNISWHGQDALPFSLCISSASVDGLPVRVSVAYGNNVLADHGFTVQQALPPVPQTGSASALPVTVPSAAPCSKPVTTAVPVRYRPSLAGAPVTQAAAYNEKKPPASALAARMWEVRDVALAVFLLQQGVPGEWLPQHDLLNSKHNDEHFVVETESDGVSSLRFGDDVQGQRPGPGTHFTATYRVGNGTRGNVGAYTLTHLVSNAAEITTDTISALWNPLPAVGGTEPESMQSARMRAPSAFRRQERAVTLADYEEMSKRCSTRIQRSTASLRWTGSWRTVFLTVDKLGGEKIDPAFETSLRNCLEKYRIAGQDLEVDGPVFVSLEIEMDVCVQPAYFKSDVKAALLQVFSNRMLPDGRGGVFHPDNFSFGQPVYLSLLYAAAQQVAGIQSIKITKFQRQGTSSTQALEDGKLPLGRLEIARLDNDPNFPEHGVFTLHMLGGK